MTQKTVHVFFLALFIFCCSAFDFTLDRSVSESLGSSKPRDVCGVLRCVETLTNASLSVGQGNLSRQLSSVELFRRRHTGHDSSGRWQSVASVTPEQPRVDRVSDGMRATGQHADQQASLSVELVKDHDCHNSQFMCVVVSVDNQGQTSVKKSVVGKTVDPKADIFPHDQPDPVSVSSGKLFALDDQWDSPGTLAKLTSLFQMKLDWIESRVGGSLRTLENRLEDKVEDVRATLDLKMSGIENRLEDKITRLHSRVIEVLAHTETAKSESGGVYDRLASKLDRLDNELRDSRNQLDTCVAEVTKLADGKNGATADLSGKMSVAVSSMQSLERNLTSFEDHLDKLETATKQCVLKESTQLVRQTDLVSSIASLAENTQNMVSRFDAFSKAYGGGALEPVEEFFDLLGTGEKEWRLAFRGTPYINIRVYPAYVHGTGIPVEVEAGCKQFNRSVPCVNHYRNRDVLDNWAGIDEVLFAVFKDDQIVHKVLFNGKGSSYTTWLAPDRVIESSWTDLTIQPHNIFSIEGYVGSTAQRRFFINLDYDRSCDGFRGWFLAGDTNDGCAVEKTVSYPTFFYAIRNTFAVWTSSNVGRADAFGVFAKYD